MYAFYRSYAIEYDNIDLKRFTFHGSNVVNLEVKEASDFIIFHATELGIEVFIYTFYLFSKLL